MTEDQQHVLVEPETLQEARESPLGEVYIHIYS